MQFYIYMKAAKQLIAHSSIAFHNYYRPPQPPTVVNDHNDENSIRPPSAGPIVPPFIRLQQQQQAQFGHHLNITNFGTQFGHHSQKLILKCLQAK